MTADDKTRAAFTALAQAMRNTHESRNLAEIVATQLQQMRFGPETFGAWLTVQLGGGRRGRKRALALCHAMALASLHTLHKEHGGDHDALVKAIEAAIRGDANG